MKKIRQLIKKSDRADLKRIFKSTASVNGTFSVGAIVLVLCIVVAVNLVAGQLPESVKNIDITDNKIYEISDTSKKIIKNLDQEITMTVYAEKSSADERIKTFLDKYASLSSKITVEWVDPVLHPAELTENNASENSILVKGEETGKTTDVLFSDIIVTDEYSYYMTGEATETEFDGEGQLTSALNYVSGSEQKKIYYTSGHGEDAFSDSVTKLLDKNNLATEELNLIMTNEIPDDCDLLVMNGVVEDITDGEKTLLTDYLSAGGKVMILLGNIESDVTNLDAVLKEYGMQRVDGYIADMERCYQGNYYYIFPILDESGEYTEGMDTGMVMLGNAQGMTVTDAERDTIAVTQVMTTSSNAYAVTEDAQEQGTYTLGAVATETVGSEEATDVDSEEESTDTSEETESRLTVVSSASLLDSQITDSFGGLENLTMFVNMVSANFEDVDNAAIEPKSLQITYNTMQYGGMISILIIFVLPFVIVLYGLVSWWKRRKA